jgi:hypothetical protein
VLSASPDSLHTVLAKNLIRRDDRTILLEGLSGEQAVERVAMMEWERRNPCDVTKIDRKLAKRVGRNMLRNESVDRSGQSQLSQADFDRHFPATRQAEQALVRWIREYGFCPPGERRRVFYPPEEGVRIEQHAHQL